MIKNFRIHNTQIFGVLLGIIILLSNSGWDKRYPLLGTFLYSIGIVLVGIALIGRLWCSLYIAGYKTKELITDGPYSMSRNPLYFFSFLGAIGVGFASESFLIPMIILVAFSLYYPQVIRNEEAKLEKTHGVIFDMYRANVPCFFPKLSNFSEPQEYIVKPVIFRKHMISALWFIWLIGILEIIEELHQLRIIPILFTIY
jgi:protein-S-isoprenylcysteine O-methyltransferase Ste14